MAATSEWRDSLHADERQESLQNPVNDTTGPVDQEKSVPDVADFGPAPEGGTRAYVTDSRCPQSHAKSTTLNTDSAFFL